MSVEIPASHHDLAYGKYVVTFVTLLPDGSPHATAVWRIFDDDGLIKISTVRQARKAQNAINDKRVNVMLINPENPGQYLEIRGEVVSVDDDLEGEFLKRVSTFYTGAPWETDPAGRVVISIQPNRVVAL